jgi:hypothetical protein
MVARWPDSTRVQMRLTATGCQSISFINDPQRTFAHSGTIVHDKGGNIFIVRHVESVC